MSFENASQSYCGVVSKDGKGSDAYHREKIYERDFLEREKLLKEKLFGKSECGKNHRKFCLKMKCHSRCDFIATRFQTAFS
jgi:hypothetical protein